MSMDNIGQFITSVEPNSPAFRYGIKAGERLLRINGEVVKDLIDYEYLTAKKSLEIELDTRIISLHKCDWEPLGLCFSTSLMSRMQTCKNKCVFCFIDQMPKGGRSSLQVKDDDWRLSFIMGNYVTLTNLDDLEFERLLRRKVSPLYISVHATDPQTRVRMMSNPTATRLMERLSALKAAGLNFHCQVVLCPDINDGGILEQTIKDLASLRPCCSSIAIVPVGLTRYREGLFALRAYTADESARIIEQIEAIQQDCLKAFNTRFVFLADEWYLQAGQPLPCAEKYEDYPQIENGVGLLRLFEEDFDSALENRVPFDKLRRVSIAGGMAAYPFFYELYKSLLPYNIDVKIYPIENRYFGGNVHVAGLVTGADIAEQLKGKELYERLLIPQNMLREREDVFLDNVSVESLEKELGIKIQAFSDGSALVEMLFS